MHKISTLHLVVALILTIGSVQGARAADFEKIFGTWVLSGSTANPNMPDSSCGASSYAFTATVETVRLSGGALNGALIPTNVTYVSGGGGRIGVYGNSGRPTTFQMIDEDHIKREDDVLQCIFTRQK